MSTVKLTLSIPEKLLSEAKEYAERVGEPLSRLVSRYFSVLSEQGGEGAAVSPKVRRVTGIAKSDRAGKELLFESFKGKYHLDRGSR